MSFESLVDKDLETASGRSVSTMDTVFSDERRCARWCHSKNHG